MYGSNGVGTCLYDALRDPRVAQRVTLSSITLECDSYTATSLSPCQGRSSRKRRILDRVRDKLLAMRGEDAIKKLMLPSAARTVDDLYEFYSDDESSVEIVDEMAMERIRRVQKFSA